MEIQTGAAVVVHSLDHARAALAAARDLGIPVILVSPPAFAAYAGAGFFERMIAAAREGFEDVEMTAVLDCGSAAGHALAALRTGVNVVAIRLGSQDHERMAEIAASYGATVVRPIVGAFDMAVADDPQAGCRAWLARRAAT
jgi:fructose/tagatose bisphosphate aldolase